MLRKVEVRYLGGCEYVFTERECEIIEKYFDSIIQFMDEHIVEVISCDFDCDNVELVANYDSYLFENDYGEEQEFSQIMFNEFGVCI